MSISRQIYSQKMCDTNSSKNFLLTYYTIYWMQTKAIFPQSKRLRRHFEPEEIGPASKTSCNTSPDIQRGQHKPCGYQAQEKEDEQRDERKK